MESFELFSEYSRPELGRTLRALNLAVEYESGQGDWLVPRAGSRPGTDGRHERVLDLVGGFGASLFGHNHPALVEIATRLRREKAPFNVQASVRSETGHLANTLSTLVGRHTNSTYVTTLGNSGAEVVEGAAKHAVIEWRRSRERLLDDVRRTGRLLRRDGLHDQIHDGGASLGDLVDETIDVICASQSAGPAMVALYAAFHGKTSAAGGLTDGGGSPKDMKVPGPRVIRVDPWVSSSYAIDALDAELVSVRLVRVSPTGRIAVTETQLSSIAAIFVEPIQGEGGVREISDDLLRSLRALADRHGAALVMDEIQSGMGRTGTFLASEPSGVVADYYLLSKSLGGGLAKIAALLVDSRRYVDDFGRYHTSTFADDEYSSAIARGALTLYEQSTQDIARSARMLGDMLNDLAQRWPDVILGVRGRGLLLGVEFALPEPESRMLSHLLNYKRLGYVLAGRFLHEHGIRVMPTLSAPTTLRIQPSAYIGRTECKQVVAAFEEIASLLRDKDFATLLEHLTAAPDSNWVVPRTRTAAIPAHAPRPQGPRSSGHVAFLANLDTATTVRSIAPELARWSEAQCANLLDRARGELEPFEVARNTVSSPRGAVTVSVIAVPVSAEQIVADRQSGNNAWVQRMVLDAVELAVEQGATVVGLGGYTSIVTNAGRDVIEDRVVVTSGNSLTAACAYAQVREHLAQLPPGERRVGVLGALGNIGSVLATLLAPECDSLSLVGTVGSASRLHRLAEELTGTDVVVSESLEDLRKCGVVITATNAALPILTDDMIATDRTVLVCDLAVPGDTDPSVGRLPNVSVVSGGRVRLPLDQDPHFPGIDLGPGTVYACMAESILLGIDHDAASPSYGGLTASGVLAADALARRHDFTPVLPVTAGNLE